MTKTRYATLGYVMGVLYAVELGELCDGELKALERELDEFGINIDYERLRRRNGRRQEAQA